MNKDSGKPVTIITPPPIHNKEKPEKGVNITVLNITLIDNTPDHIELLNTEEDCLQNIPKTKALQQDGYHVSDHGARARGGTQSTH